MRKVNHYTEKRKKLKEILKILKFHCEITLEKFNIHRILSAEYVIKAISKRKSSCRVILLTCFTLDNVVCCLEAFLQRSNMVIILRTNIQKHFLSVLAKMSVVVPTVLGSVNATFSWMLQYMNGGILNALVEPTTPGEGSPSFELKPDPNILLKLLLGKMDAASLAVLGALPADLGGGAGGVKNATDHPNREGTLMIASLVFLVLAVLILLILFILSCVCCCCYSSGRRRKIKKSAKDSDSEDTSSVYTVSSSDYTEEKVELSKEYQNIFCCGLHLLVIVFTALCVVGLIVSLGYYVGAASTLSEVLVNKTTNKADAEQWLKGETSAFSFGGLLEFGTTEIFSFVKESVEMAKQSTTKAVTKLDQEVIQTTLPDQITTFVHSMIAIFKLKEVQQAVDTFASEFKVLSEASQHIRENRQQDVDNVLKYENDLNSALDAIDNKCPAAEPKPSGLKSTFDKGKVKPIPEEMNKLLTDMSIALEGITERLNNMVDKVDHLDESIKANFTTLLDVNAILEELNGIWDALDGQTDEMEQTMTSYLATFSGYVGQYSSLVKALLLVLAIPFLLAAIFFTLFLVVFIVEALYRHLFSLTGTSASEVAAGDPWIAKSCVCGAGKFCCCSCLLILPVLLLGIFACLAITLNGFVGVEVCPYIANTIGINMTDYVLNSKLQTIWNDKFNPTDPSNPSERQTGDLGNLLNPKPPQNLLYAVEVGCAPSSTAQETPASGLLAQMGMTNLVDFSAFVNSQDIKKSIADVKTQLITTISGMGLSEAIPDEKLAEMEQSIANLNEAITILQLPETATYLESWKSNTERIKELLKDPCAAKNASLPQEFETSNAAMKTLYEKYKTLVEKSKQLSLTDLTTVLEELKEVTKDDTSIGNAIGGPFDQFTQTVLNSVDKTGTEAFDTITEELMPCGSLHYAVKSMIYMGCGPSGMAPRLFAWGLFFALCLLFTVLTFISLFCLWRVQNHQAKRFAGAEYEVVY